MWLSFKLRDGRIGVCHEADVKSAAADPAHSFAKVQFRDGVEDEIIDAQGHYTLAEALAVMFSAMAPNVRTCRVCGCTDDDCSQCVERTGMPCSWVEDDLCSACNVEPPVKALDDDCPRCKIPWALCPCDSTPDQQKGTVLEEPFPKPRQNPGGEPCGECHLRPGETCDVCKAKDPREPDGFPAPTGDGTADLQRIDAHLGETAAEKLAALPETRQLPIAHGQGLSPLQDGNHPEIKAHRQRLSEATGDPMASAKALLARKDAKT